ncbi:hypothetical protein PSD17_66660 [Pseudonocardia sp. D17]|nr:hypothetical protein PSD17_66660 [Pseudonocardia sp. D17]
MLGRRGALNTSFGRLVWSRVRRPERIEALENGEPVTVRGYEMAPALGPDDRRRLSLFGTYTLTPEGLLE